MNRLDGIGAWYSFPFGKIPRVYVTRERVRQCIYTLSVFQYVFFGRITDVCFVLYFLVANFFHTFWHFLTMFFICAINCIS